MRVEKNIAVFAMAALLCAGSDLAHRLDALTGSVPGHGFAGIEVVETATGKPLYQRNADKLFLPGSNMKLFTTALALERLGPDYRFTTRVIREASGDLVLVGSGDPSLSGRVFPYQKDADPGPALAAIDALADRIVASGVTRVDGDIVGDDSLYPWSPYAPSWTEDDLLHDYGAAVSALSVNDNVVTIEIRPGAKPGDPAALSIDPPLEYYAIDNRVETVERGAKAKLHISRQPGSRQLSIWGGVAASGPGIRAAVAIDDPALFAAYALDDALTRRGVAITGRPIARHRAVSDEYN
ncbi:MAG: D-alanyl-D-alanine carboxypeptidase/D-alanyl-D-alanine endopeptidase, partial [Bryobacteraceae bacterium]